MARLRWVVVPLAAAALAAAVFRPVCVALSPEQLASLTSPIETRSDRDFYLTVFQQREGRWVQCKTWISRALFF
jgi:hypothetical protein